MEICQTVTIRSFSLVFLSGTILNKESCSKTHTTQGHSRIRILTLSSIKRLPLKTLKDPLTEHVIFPQGVYPEHKGKANQNFSPPIPFLQRVFLYSLEIQLG